MLSDGPDELLNGYDCDNHLYHLLKKTKKLTPSRIEEIKKIVSERTRWKGKSQKFLNWKYYISSPNAVRPNHAGTTPDELSSLISKSYKNKAFKKYGSFLRNDLFSLNKLDDAQNISAGYLGSSIPDYINTRSDRGVMKEGIEARLPFLATPIVELFMSTPEKFRLSSDSRGKIVLRNLVNNYVGQKVSTRQKYGFSTPNWQKPINQNKLGVRDIIRSSSIFDRKVFNSNIRDYVLSNGNERLLWMAYSLAKTADRLKNIRKGKI